jgi:hypothetical protein
MSGIVERLLPFVRHASRCPALANRVRCGASRGPHGGACPKPATKVYITIVTNRGRRSAVRHHRCDDHAVGLGREERPMPVPYQCTCGLDALIKEAAQ